MIYDIAIVGGGASGLIAATEAARLGASTILLERQPRVGKKLLATGNGRCNLLNTNPLPKYYHGGTDIMSAVMREFPPDAIIEKFKSFGVEPYYDGPRVYPLSLQASSVLDALRLTAEERGVTIACEFDVSAVARRQHIFQLNSKLGSSVEASKLIMCTGSSASAGLSGTDSGLIMMQSLGHKVVKFQPALVQLQTHSPELRAVKGISFEGSISIDIDGDELRRERGEILFTEYGLSGIAVMQVSRVATIALNKKRRVRAVLHIMDRDALDMLRLRRDALGARPLENFLTGMINKRLGQTILKLAGCQPFSRLASTLSDAELSAVAALLSDWPIEVVGTQGLKSAQVASGGVAASELDVQTLESQVIPGLYAAGELIDVDGDCGGFNLLWAWASGLLAARSACVGG